MNTMKTILPVLALLASLPAAGQERVIQSVVPALAFGPHCSSSVTLQNLSDRAVRVDVEAHKAGGALAPMAEHPEIAVRLAPHAQSRFQPKIEEETEGAWIELRERVPLPNLSPVLAISGTTECVIADKLRTAGREVVYPTRNPWFEGDVSNLTGDLISLINTTEQAAKASLCYSSGSLFSTAAELKPVCSAAYDVRIPPFGAREFPVSHEGSTHLSLKTEGAAMVLEMLRPLGTSIQMYTVDSTIHFGSEVPPPKR